ncbi:hypothetical protein EIN_030740 [Entamoeba invadens IP1]|uniref:Uncharacterized protein n=1 Tax=Entamoeba invadens IP1 TaxID=370355 RepID=A0A0A1U1C9_ENTIV|nr:hypothetical protein EIN_030740 [Entamoeba invadens IP1]ELP86403.1 hypothetical protein EIN_030740 [Entamoeba invadens IP1]|eukprot:XP_004185749.1 hypothetical protein EIN_030740 [Entamoeba invadens IP1]
MGVLNVAVVGDQPLMKELLTSLEKETSQKSEALGDESILSGQIELEGETLKLRYISNASDLSVEECNLALVCVSDDKLKEAEAVVERVTLNITGPIFSYCKTKMFDALKNTKLIPPQTSVLSILFYVQKQIQNRLPIGDIVKLIDFEEDARKTFENKVQQQKDELARFAQKIEHDQKDLQEKITEQSLLTGLDSSEDIEEVHYEEDENETHTTKSQIQKKGQMVFGPDGKMTFKQQQKKAAKKVAKKKK